MVFPLQTRGWVFRWHLRSLSATVFPQGLWQKRKPVLRDEKPPLISTVSDYSWMESLKSNTLGMGRSWWNGGDGWEVTLSDGRVYGGGRIGMRISWDEIKASKRRRIAEIISGSFGFFGVKLKVVWVKRPTTWTTNQGDIKFWNENKIFEHGIGCFFWLFKSRAAFNIRRTWR